jgi:hypothetical protein
LSKTTDPNLHPEHSIPMDEINKLEKFRVMKELEDEPGSVILEVEELKER